MSSRPCIARALASSEAVLRVLSTNHTYPLYTTSVTHFSFSHCALPALSFRCLRHNNSGSTPPRGSADDLTDSVVCPAYWALSIHMLLITEAGNLLVQEQHVRSSFDVSNSFQEYTFNTCMYSLTVDCKIDILDVLVSYTIAAPTDRPTGLPGTTKPPDTRSKSAYTKA
jgi:hypothetical protein